MRALLLLLLLLPAPIVSAASGSNLLRWGNKLAAIDSYYLSLYDTDNPGEGVVRYHPPLGLSSVYAADATRFYVISNGAIYSYIPGGDLVLVVPTRFGPRLFPEPMVDDPRGLFVRDGYLFVGYQAGLSVFRLADGQEVRVYPDMVLARQACGFFFSAGGSARRVLDGGELGPPLPHMSANITAVEGMDAILQSGLVINPEDGTVLGSLPPGNAAAANEHYIVVETWSDFRVYDRATLKLRNILKRNQNQSLGALTLVGDSFKLITWASMNESVKVDALEIPAEPDPVETYSVDDQHEPLPAWGGSFTLDGSLYVLSGGRAICQYELGTFRLIRQWGLTSELHGAPGGSHLCYDPVHDAFVFEGPGGVDSISRQTGACTALWNLEVTFACLPDGTLLVETYGQRSEIAWYDPYTRTIYDRVAPSGTDRIKGNRGYTAYLLSGEVITADPQTHTLSLTPTEDYHDSLSVSPDGTARIWRSSTGTFVQTDGHAAAAVTGFKVYQEWWDGQGGWMGYGYDEVVLRVDAITGTVTSPAVDSSVFDNLRFAPVPGGWVSLQKVALGTAPGLMLDAFGGNLVGPQGYTLRGTSLGHYYRSGDWYYFSDLDAWLYALPAGTPGMDGAWMWAPGIGWMFALQDAENWVYSFERDSWLYWWGGRDKPWWFYQCRNGRTFALMPGFAPATLSGTQVVASRGPRGDEIYDFSDHDYKVGLAGSTAWTRATYTWARETDEHIVITFDDRSMRIIMVPGQPDVTIVDFTGTLTLDFTDYEAGTFILDGAMIDDHGATYEHVQRSGPFTLTGDKPF